MEKLIEWHTSNGDIINFIKDIIFAIGFIATLYSYLRFMHFLSKRSLINKSTEMKNDTKAYSEISENLASHVNNYTDASYSNRRDIGISLLHIKNYPYRFDDDGYTQMLYSYFESEGHDASGYITTKGIYIMNHIWFLGERIYYNSKSEKWFVDRQGKSFKGYEELPYRQLIKRLPFSNIVGYDFNSDWSNNSNPVFYTRYKHSDRRLYTDEVTAIDINQQFHLTHKT